MTKWYWRVGVKLQAKKKYVDCYYYYNSTCNKGESCPFRHEPRALGCEEDCPAWKKDKKCKKKNCRFRHIETTKGRNSEPCFFENTSEGCLKPHCPFLHKNSTTISAPSGPFKTGTEFSRDVGRGHSDPCHPELRSEDFSNSTYPTQQININPRFTSSQEHLSHEFRPHGAKWDLTNSPSVKPCTITSGQLSDPWTGNLEEQDDDLVDPWIDGSLDDDKVKSTADSVPGPKSQANLAVKLPEREENKGPIMPTLMPDSDSEDDLPPGWEERATFDGSVYYVNHSTKSTQWTHPRTGKKKKVAGELPFGWEKVVEGSGKVLYVDHENHRTTYTDPRLAFAQEEKDTPLGFRQRFDGSSTALQVLHGRDLSGKTAIVTGANCGIGFETARALARHGCHVVLACRSVTRASKAIERIRSDRSQALCTAVPLDLRSLKSVKEFVNTIRGDPQFNRGIDVLILNAGVFALPYSLTEDGLETTFQVNYLSQFYLTILLEEMLAKAAPSRVVFVSSESHRFSTMSPSNISEEWLSPKFAQFWSMMAYNDSKLCSVVAARELARRWVTRDICVFSCHPGNMVSSNLSRYWWPYKFLFTLVRPFTKSLDQAASTQVYCASALELSDVSGLYFNNCCRCEPSKPSQEPELAAKLWKISIDLIASHFSSLDIPDKYRSKR